MAEDEKAPTRLERIAARAAKGIGYAGLGLYVYFGILQGQDVSEVFLGIIALLIKGDMVLEKLGGKK